MRNLSSSSVLEVVGLRGCSWGALGLGRASGFGGAFLFLGVSDDAAEKYLKHGSRVPHAVLSALSSRDFGSSEAYQHCHLVRLKKSSGPFRPIPGEGG